MSLHSWSFFRAGGVDQVKLESSDDLRNLGQLDKKLWVALALPTAGVVADPRTLAMLDADGDGRIRAADILTAVAFVCERLKEPRDLLVGARSLRPTSIRDDNPLGTGTLSATHALLKCLGKASIADVTLEDVADSKLAFATMPLNGDGVVPPFATTDAALAGVIGEILACVGGVPDRSGKDGVNAEKVDAFFAACAAHLAWVEAGATVPTLARDAMKAASAAASAVRAKVEDYYARARVVAFDPRASATLDISDASFAGMGTALLAGDLQPLEGQPLAHVDPAGALPLEDGVNPAWRGRLATLRSAAVRPLLGDRTTLSAADWRQLEQALAPYDGWQADRAGVEVESLGLDRIKTLVAGDFKQALHTLIDADLAQKPQADGIDDVVRLVHYHAHLGQVLRNFVSFADFYGRKQLAIFQFGRAFFDKRSYDLVLPVVDAGRHGSMAGRAGVYLAYLDCTRRSDGLKANVCVAVTDGDSDNLMVGRNGLFYDREGRDYDATITKIIDNPISLRQAFWAPYKKFVRAIEDMVTKRAQAAEAESDAAMAKAAESTANADKAAPPPPSKIDIGTVAALGVAVGGITAALGAIFGAIFGLGYLMPVGILGIMLAISGPSVLLAALKLRRRNLGPLLDADGWAVNASALINIPFGRSLTQLAVLPAGSSRDLVDPFAEKKSKAPFYVTLLVLVVVTGILWFNGLIPGLAG